MRKKILFISPSSYDKQGNIIKSHRALIPSRTMPYLAALTPLHFDMQIIDELVEDIPFNKDVHLVALTGMITHIPRAIDIAHHFRKKGTKTIIGGSGVFSITDYVKKSGAFDSIVLGEADELWKIIIDDFDSDRLQPLYQCTNLPLLDKLPFARYDLVNKKKYMKSSYDKSNPRYCIETTRGCPHNCKFCMVTNYFGKKIRHRPISDVINEINFNNSKHILFTDDNIIFDRAYAKELFTALKPLKIKWFGQFETTVCKYPEMIRLANESGCSSAFIGVESTNMANLKEMKKKHNIDITVKDIADAFKGTNIYVSTSFIFGGDGDTSQSILNTVDELVKNNIDEFVPWILTPFPGTSTYDEIKNQKRIISENYSMYDAMHTIFRPKNIQPEQLEQIYWKSYQRFYTTKAIIRRLLFSKKSGLLEQLFYELRVAKMVYKKRHPWRGIGSYSENKNHL